ncbi:hypothetical protein GCM10007972_13080 [Iodidimonas muriae]|uniref:UspA domain-containing protein n=1 Tax=Iodidimonas muriae TaxID=261467 RepID=A0ABQ2LEH4_9PROT|nr:universal stress protein [Iodidimonas muriae]GER06685.1 hypothetical protein JCM17843_09950 [Kordiimonadales bacterium JCM 17843]GGO10370.1 hypothetical protein GCM10007972_13080 [Iodidimonas muriae]
MKKILVATDFSERSDRAIRRATLLARTFDAALLLVHVIDDDQPQRIVRAEQQASADLLAAQTRSLREVDGLRCEFRIVFGEPFEGITQLAREANADLLVIGPHRRQALKDVFVGTTAERIIRSSDRPVLMANATPAGPYRHGLVASDLSECSGDALNAVQSLGLSQHMKVSLIHVFDAVALWAQSRASLSEDEVKDYLDDEEERAAAELSAFLAKLGLDPMPQILKPATAPVAQVISSVARDIATDLVIVGTHGRTGIAKMLLGSVTEELLRAADRDVLAVPPRRAGQGAA